MRTYEVFKELVAQEVPVCNCEKHQKADTVEYCPACECYTDSCVACGVPEPECSCTQLDVDLFDYSTCHLCDPQSGYNILMRRHHARTVRNVADTPRKPAAAQVCFDCRELENNCHCDPFAVRRSA